jgi:regulator of sigma E protease
MLVSAITVILVLSFLIFVHELGHYLAARSVGVTVLEFSMGFPPKIFSKIVGKTEYILSLIPIGGYVRLLGQNIDDENPDEPGNYASKSVWRRLLILIAGPLMNLLFALIFMCLVIFLGQRVPAYYLNAPLINGIVTGSPADKLNLRKNDLILSVNGNGVENWKAVQSQLQKSSGPVIELRISRDGAIIERDIDAAVFKNKARIGWKISIEPVVGQISPNSPAEKSGLQTGDRILNVNGVEIKDWSQVSPSIQQTKGKDSQISILRDESKLEFSIKPQWNETNSYWVLGIGSQTVHASENLVDSFSLGATQMYLITGKTFEFLSRLVRGQESTKSMGGPIMIAQMVGQAAQSDFSNLLFLVGYISLQFAVFNLLPIPALDGGHIFFLLVEKIKGSALPKGFRVSVQKAGFSLLLLLILYISVQDGMRIFQGM